MKCGSLEEVRLNIDRIDAEIIRLIAERGSYVNQASAFKKDEAGVKDTGRVEKVIAKARERAEESGADPDLVEAVYREIVIRDCRQHLDVVVYRHFNRCNKWWIFKCSPAL